MIYGIQWGPLTSYTVEYHRTFTEKDLNLVSQGIQQAKITNCGRAMLPVLRQGNITNRDNLRSPIVVGQDHQLWQGKIANCGRARSPILVGQDHQLKQGNITNCGRARSPIVEGQNPQLWKDKSPAVQGQNHNVIMMITLQSIPVCFLMLLRFQNAPSEFFPISHDSHCNVFKIDSNLQYIVSASWYLRIYEQIHFENRWSNRKISESTGSTTSA